MNYRINLFGRHIVPAPIFGINQSDTLVLQEILEQIIKDQIIRILEIKDVKLMIYFDHTEMTMLEMLLRRCQIWLNENN